MDERTRRLERAYVESPSKDNLLAWISAAESAAPGSLIRLVNNKPVLMFRLLNNDRGARKLRKHPWPTQGSATHNTGSWWALCPRKGGYVIEPSTDRGYAWVSPDFALNFEDLGEAVDYLQRRGVDFRLRRLSSVRWWYSTGSAGYMGYDNTCTREIRLVVAWIRRLTGEVSGPSLGAARARVLAKEDIRRRIREHSGLDPDLFWFNFRVRKIKNTDNPDTQKGV